MHQQSFSELQGVSPQRGAPTQRTTRDRASRSSRLSRGSVCCCLCPPRAAPLWAWLLLGTLVVPGAWSFLSEEQEELLVELHNHYRGQVSPSASAMLPLKWDPGLKLIAEGYATKCIWNHNPELEDTGENLFAGTGPLDLREALEKWFLEHLDYDYQNNSCDEDKMCGHYTQMVWAGTHRVGCAFHLCNNMEGLEWERVSFLVCNYYPAGNYEDERPYVEGDWCSSCPDNLQKCENNLCVEEDDEGGEGWGTDAPTPATSDPSLQPEEKNEEEKVPPPTTTDAQPATTTTPIPTPAPAPTSAPTVASTTASILTWDSEDTPLPATTAPDTPPPNVHSTTQREEEEWVEEKIQTHEEEEEVKRRWDEERKKTMDMMEREREKEVVQKTHPNTKRADSAGAVSSPSLLLVCLTGILTLRL